MIRVGVVVDQPAADVDYNGSFLEILLVAFEGAFDNMPEEAAIPLAIPKDGAREDPLQLLAHFLIEEVGG